MDPEALFELFQDWQRTQTQSSVTAFPGLRQQMVSGSAKTGTTAERHTCGLENLLYTFCALLRSARQVKYFFLTKTYMDVGDPEVEPALMTGSTSPELLRHSP